MGRLWGLGILLFSGAAGAGLEVRSLRCEYTVDPIGIDAARPRLSWVLESAGRGQKQAAYQILAGRSPEVTEPDLWDSGKVESDRTAHVIYAGKELASGERAYWKVRVWDRDGAVATSPTAFFEAGLLKPEDWSAKWIGLKPGDRSDLPKLASKELRWIWFPEGEPARSAPKARRYLRRAFDLPAGRAVKSAFFVGTADNSFVLYLNGREALKGGQWTRFELADLAARLATGRNVLAARVENAGVDPAGFVGQLVVAFDAGEPLVVVTDKSWKASEKGPKGWQTAAFDDQAWPAALEAAPFGGGPWKDGLTEKSIARPSGDPAAFLRKTFTLGGAPTRARLYATALGLYEVSINGKRVGDSVLAPGWTDYAKRVPYQTYDVTGLLAAGENAIDAVLGDGWYAGKIGWLKLGHNTYGPLPPHARFQLEAAGADGKVERIVSDGSWKAATGPLLSSDLLDGEVYDARREVGPWRDADVFEDNRRLVADPGPPIRVTRDLRAVKLAEPKPGHWTFDLGQNMVGWARLTASAPAGTTVTLRFAEILNPDGTIYTTNLRAAKCTDRYTFKGGGEETWEPRFTFHGFRYVELTGLPGGPALVAVTGRVVTSDTPPTGTFECSNPMLNRLQKNIVWGQRGNFLSIPTDCPQRDERLGWMGDAQIFVRTACFNMDVAAFFTKWLRDVEDAQSPDGAFADISPRLTGILPMDGAPAWGDAGVICPWVIYERYDDTRVLEEHYGSFVRWIDHVRNANPDLVWTKRVGNNYGDWVSIASNTDKAVLATAFFAQSARLVGRIAKVLGKAEDAKKYEELFRRIRAAFQKAFVAADGRIKSDTQTCYVLALRFDLLPDELRPAAVKYLVEDIERKKGHLSTGFLGVGHLLPVLSQAGRYDVAYRLLLNDTFPSWGYSNKHGATTIWERWDGWTAEKGFQDPGMNSFNHYSFGSVGEWMYAHVAGLEAASPGYKRVLVRPRPGGGVTWARASYESIYGRISTAWKIEGKAFTLKVIIPANASATVDLPFEGGVKEVGSGAHEFSVPVP